MNDHDRLLDGTKTAAAIRGEVAAEVATLRAAGVTPRLDVVLAGDDPASRVYVSSKAKACGELGIESHTHELPAAVAQAELEALVDRLNADREVDGILVQLPLPAGLDSHAVLDRVDPGKDVDGFHPHNVGLLQQGRPGLTPCTPAGIMELLRREGIELSGRRAVVVGRSDIVGKPMAMMLLHAHATVTLCHSRTRDLAAVTRQAEILVVAAGRLALVGAEHVADGAVVVDVGVHRVEDRATVERLFPGNPRKLATFASRGAVLAGDVDFTAVAPRAGRITPVPGGVGPLTIAMLMSNAVRAARRRRGV
jgi:methylenetetrahydrofolate dehydrogenase (NADP+)/methenyltetrahydrofolate cyclohydrolase